ncbi:MAG: hypothetical protein PHO30_03530 [Candidatus Omnitrophica bacterium]|nr:hypothetical protein [Candidatus Omnitrophota bacterium]
MRTIVGILALLSLVIVAAEGYAADNAAPPVAQKVLTSGEKLSREEASAERKALESDIDNAAAEREQQRIDAEAAQAVEKAQSETDQIRQQLQDEVIKAQQEAEREAEQIRKTLEEEQSKAIQEAMLRAEEESKQLDRELEKIKIVPPKPR